MMKTKMIKISDAILVVFNNGVAIRSSIKCTGGKRMMRVKFSDPSPLISNYVGVILF